MYFFECLMLDMLCWLVPAGADWLKQNINKEIDKTMM